MNFFSGQTPPVGNALTAPQVPIGQADPSQMNMWQKFMEKVKNDPNFRMALMTAGANMLRTPEVGQTGFDTFANASLAGMGTLDQLRTRQRGEETEAQKTAFEQGATTRQLDQGAERNRLAGERNELDRSEENQRRVEAQQRYAIALKELEQRRREYNAPSKLTGAERQTNALIEALVGQYPDQFTDDADGRQKALLYLRDLEAARANPTTLLTLIDTKAARYELFNDLSPEEAKAKARADVLGDLKSVVGTQQIETDLADDLDGVTINHKTQGPGKVRKVGENLYKVDFEGGSSATVSGEYIRDLIANQGNK